MAIMCYENRWVNYTAYHICINCLSGLEVGYYTRSLAQLELTHNGDGAPAGIFR